MGVGHVRLYSKELALETHLEAEKRFSLPLPIRIVGLKVDLNDHFH